MSVFHYHVRDEDLIELSLHRFRADRRARLQALAFQFLVPLVIFLGSIGTVYLLHGGRTLTPLDWVVPCVLAVAMVLVFPRSFEANMRKRVAAQFQEGSGKDLVGRHTAKITQEQIVQTSRGNELRAPWSAVASVTATDEHIFLLVNDGQAMVIPRRGFASAGQYDQARALVAQYQRGGA